MFVFYFLSFCLLYSFHSHWIAFNFNVTVLKWEMKNNGLLNWSKLVKKMYMCMFCLDTFTLSGLQWKFLMIFRKLKSIYMLSPCFECCGGDNRIYTNSWNTEKHQQQKLTTKKKREKKKIKPDPTNKTFSKKRSAISITAFAFLIY